METLIIPGVNGEYLSVPEAARALDLHEDTLRKAIRSDKLRAKSLYGRVLIHRDDLAAYRATVKIGRPRKAEE